MFGGDVASDGKTWRCISTRALKAAKVCPELALLYKCLKVLDHLNSMQDVILHFTKQEAGQGSYSALN